MEKCRVLQLPFIILLSFVLAIVVFNNQKIAEENSVLTMKLSDLLITSKNDVTPLNVTANNCMKTPQTVAIHNATSSNINVEKYPDETVQPVISEVEITQANQNIKAVAFEDQQIDYEWAIFMETAVSDAFQTSKILEKFTLDKVECRSSVCEIRMPKGQEDTFHQSVLVLFALEEIGIKHNTLTMSSDTAGDTVVFYFSPNQL